MSKDAFSGVAMGNPPSPPTPLPHCGRGANLKHVDRVVILSEACIAHIFCPLLKLWEQEVGGMRDKGAWEYRESPFLPRTLPLRGAPVLFHNDEQDRHC